MIEIYYQGDIGSNSEQAAMHFAARNNLSAQSLIPMGNSHRVVDNVGEE